MESINLIQDLAIVLLGAGVAGALCKRIGISVIVGYLAAGMLLGPNTPPFSFILDVKRIEALSHLGLVFLMFSIGLGLSLSKIKKMGFSILMATGIGAIILLNVIQPLGTSLNWIPAKSLFVAAMFMVSSSAVISKIVRECNLGRERAGQVALAFAVMEDLVAIVMLAVLGSQTIHAGTTNIAGLLMGLSSFVVLLVIVGLSFIPKILGRVDSKADSEFQTIIVAGVLFLMSVLAVRAGYSLALGAYLLGAIVAEMPHKASVEKSFASMRDMFIGVFFVSIGMMLEIGSLVQAWPWVLGIGIFTLITRACVISFVLVLVGTQTHVARRVGLVLMPVGEFSFIIAQLGVAKSILPPDYYPIAIGVSIVTMLLAPLINRYADPLLDGFERVEPQWVTRLIESYHGWLEQLWSLEIKHLWWQSGKKRLQQLSLEVLFVTGLILFSKTLLRLLMETPIGWVIPPLPLKVTFWAMISLLVMIPLFAIWRNLAAFAAMFGEIAKKRNSRLSPVAEDGFIVVGSIFLWYWLSNIIPLDILGKLPWLALFPVMLLILMVSSHRLTHWHGMWQNSIAEIFVENLTPEIRRQKLWRERFKGWDVNLKEFVLPEHAVFSGFSIGSLQIRKRYGCSIVELERHGHVILAPTPEMELYAGDRLLLLGKPKEIEALCNDIGRAKIAEDLADFNEACLETISVPAGPRVGSTLSEIFSESDIGVLVVGIERTGAKLINPPGDERLLEGDDLLVVGSPEQIQELTDWLASSEECAEK